MAERIDWGRQSEKGFLASGIDAADRRGRKNEYIDLLQKTALDEVLDLKGDESVLDFGSGSGRISYWIASRVKKVVGLEITPEMVHLAESHRKAQNVEFLLYDGFHFPKFPCQFDLILSVWVLQYIGRDKLKGTISELAQFLRKGRKFCLIEQASDNPTRERPRVKEYLQAFEKSNLECMGHYPIRRSHWWMLYLIRYGFIPKDWFAQIAAWELKKNRKREGTISDYWDFLFLTRKV